MPSRPVLGYWPIRGVAQAIRYLLAYCEIDFEDRVYELGGPPDYSRESWKSVKFSLGLNFPNLPYFIDKRVCLTQSSAILRYIARLNNVGSADVQLQAIEDMVADVVVTLRDNFVDLCYNVEFNSIKQAFLDQLPGRLAQFNDFIGENDWICGDSISYADFILVEVLRQLQVLDPTCLGELPKLEALCNRFEMLPRISTYKTSPQHIEYPLFSNLAKFGSSIQ